MDKQKRRAVSPLAEAEMEALNAGREWTRRYLEKKLQRLADCQGAVSPPQRSAVAEGVGDRVDVDDDGR